MSLGPKWESRLGIKHPSDFVLGPSVMPTLRREAAAAMDSALAR
jgi:hypothetical protein